MKESGVSDDSAATLIEIPRLKYNFKQFLGKELTKAAKIDYKLFNLLYRFIKTWHRYKTNAAVKIQRKIRLILLSKRYSKVLPQIRKIQRFIRGYQNDLSDCYQLIWRKVQFRHQRNTALFSETLTSYQVAEKHRLMLCGYLVSSDSILGQKLFDDLDHKLCQYQHYVLA